MDGWFADVPFGDRDALAAAIRDGRADTPADWPQLAVDHGVADDRDAYYDRLHDAALAATRAAVDERERADDRQLIHAVRAMDDCRTAANDIAGRVEEWAGSLTGLDATGMAAVRAVAERTAGGEEGAASDADLPPELVTLAERAVGLDAERASLRRAVERDAPAVAPNLSALAGSVLAARLIALAGGLEPLAKLPSGTVQVLGAEDALFAHLRDGAPPPKHGVIFTHEYVSGTHPDERGSAARAVAGKLAIAARIDHYGGDRRPELDRELDDRIRRIRERSAGDSEGDEDRDAPPDPEGNR
jgi:nucleolar protein 56